MRVLWLCSILIPQIEQKLGLNSQLEGRWLTALASKMDKAEDIELAICAKYNDGNEVTKIAWGMSSIFFGYTDDIDNPIIYNKKLEYVFSLILEDYHPDIVHIFGTEYPHTLAMAKAFNNPKRTVIHLQGIISEISEVYECDLPSYVVKRNSFRDFIKKDNILQQKNKFAIRGLYEVEAARMAGNFMGRTAWDRNWVNKINPSAKYYYVQEMMRNAFYSGKWEYESCDKHTIFMCQGNYPVKGLHKVIMALAQILKKYPDANLYIAGRNPTKINSISSSVRITYYGLFLRRLISKYRLKKHITFVGYLNSEEIKKYYLKTNVCVCASSCENSSNSIGEAMLLGVPIVASDVGGTNSIITNEKEGYLYSWKSEHELYEKVVEVFDQNEYISIMSDKARLRARTQYDKDSIYMQVCNVYNDIMAY